MIQCGDLSPIGPALALCALSPASMARIVASSGKLSGTSENSGVASEEVTA
jgi:hypothetical protein